MPGERLQLPKLRSIPFARSNTSSDTAYETSYDCRPLEGT